MCLCVCVCVGGGGGLNDLKFGTFIGHFRSDGAAKHGSERVKQSSAADREHEVTPL